LSSAAPIVGGFVAVKSPAAIYQPPRRQSLLGVRADLLVSVLLASLPAEPW